MSYAPETRRRRTFAIISHPDAGKTTLTEKLLLFSGAIQIAGAVKGRKASRHATSDWMEIEKQRGISVASSVMQMLYREHVINLLDTPGHKDFSEDTYRVLTAVDSALMVIDAANGVEAQTRRLIEVCRQRNTPIISFVNKMDREVRDPLDILDEVERELGMPCCPMTWPVGQGKGFGGIIDLRSQTMTVFEPGSQRRPQDFEAIALSAADRLRQRFGAAFDAALDSMELAAGASPAWDPAAFLAGKLTPVFFGSGVNNFGVLEVLDALVDMAPPPGARISTLGAGEHAVVRTIQPEEEGFSGVVFKVQANMDANHRDRIAFVRVASGKYLPGMKLKVQRTAKELRPTSVVTFMSQRREAVQEAYAGDIIGFTTHGGVQLGDTITDGANLQFTGLPFFAPEMFMTVVLKNPLRTKQLQQGLAQLGEEGAIQVFRPDAGGNMLLGAVGQLQFEVVQHRLKAEYDADMRLETCQYTGARWITADSPAELRAFTDAYPQRMAHDAADTLAYLCTSPYDVRLAQERFAAIHFHPLREHAGLALMK
ncbi:peptide chain release factor 3 [Verminephrobacter eiseniae]|uniref:Peptide chain release factor 3 n=1 Tax=Verminephrobacter eiseniae (strain EF01-2) TaxID=391735 RepID=A1WFN3_VEREI|nr:peptide chain release factor 3 [Verminephrobacter eiseniae]ABM56440.1 bacterial peptide chain release factor 3 (bRF-3) [Verminephrobacter eiseniae EF01-2]MCW5261650.1 peptide chain release factor 3 [Verminephrobacter eiseniae]MCW5286802.1 peptide chain release factor 3 [Verminephrobacter eiseniae]MCW5305099.1 peptide chain release factor 3 [Verminephrobacter eiseniae]MCW8178931.1 peptide chain release factor 3 [Verminephrobacter eiseniae]